MIKNHFNKQYIFNRLVTFDKLNKLSGRLSAANSLAYLFNYISKQLEISNHEST